MRLGFLANFISEPVLKGFIVGLALTIIVGQLPKLFGVEKGEGDFFEKLWDLLGKLGDTHVATLAIGLVSLALVLGLRRFAPVVPGSLVAVAFGILVVELLDPSGVDIVGTIDSGLPAVGLPDAPAGLFFANAEHVRQSILAHAREDGVRAVVLDAQTVPYVDVTAAEMLRQVRDDLARDGVQLVVARDIGQVRDVLQRAGAEDAAVVFPTVEDAVSRVR